MTAFTLGQQAQRVGQYAWVELQLFEILGGWVQQVPELDVKLQLGTQSYHHAWHAELWRKRLPELADVNPDDLVVPANPALATFFDALRQADGGDKTVEKLVGVYRVTIPRVVAAYSAHLDRTTKVADAPTIRVLKLVLTDAMDDWRDGELLIHTLLATVDDARRANEHQARLEGLLVATGCFA